MPVELDLADFAQGSDFRAPLKEPEPTRISDYGRSVMAGLYGIPGSIAAGVDYATRPEEGSAFHDALSGIRDWSDEGSEYQIGNMSESGRRALQAGLLPGDDSVWQPDVSLANSLGLKVANAAPSLLASILPGGLVGSATRAVVGTATKAAVGTAVGAGMATSGSINAAMMAGQVADDIEKGVRNSTDADLRAGSTFYEHLRDNEHLSETQAKKILVEYAQGNKPAIAGLVGAVMEGGFGAGATVAKGAARAIETGAGRTALKTGAEEAVTESAQNALQEGVTQVGNIQAGTQFDIDPKKIAEQTVQGGVVGGILGAGVGAAVGGANSRRAITVQDPTKADPAIDAAFKDDPIEEPAPEPTARDRAQAGLDEAGAMLDANAANIEQAAPGAKAQRVKAVSKRKHIAAPDAAISEAIKARTSEDPVTQPTIAPEPAPVEAVPVEAAPEPFQPMDDFEVDPDTTPADNGPAPGMVRMYHGTAYDDPSGFTGKVFMSPDAQYAQDYRGREGGNNVFYADIAEDHPALVRGTEAEDVANGIPQRYMASAFDADEVRGQMKPYRLRDVAPEQVGTPQEVPVAPPAEEAAVAPSEAPQEASAISYDLADFVEPPPVPPIETPEVLKAPEDRAPRVLESKAAMSPPVTERKAPGKQARLSSKEVERIAAGEGDALTMSADPADWTKQNDKKNTFKLANAEVEAAAKSGREPAEWATKVLSTRGKTGGRHEAARAAQATYMEGRRMLHEITQARVDRGEARRETTQEAADRARVEELTKQAEAVQAHLSATPMSKAAQNGVPAAVREYARGVVAAARKAKITIPESTQDPYLLYLKNAEHVASPESNRQAHMDFVADDFLLRQGAGEELSERRKAQALKTEASYDEMPTETTDVREGTDAAELYDTATANPQEVAAEQSQTVSEYDAAPLAVAVESAERPNRESTSTVSVADAVTDAQTLIAGTDKAGTFKVEARGSRRKFTPPAKVTPVGKPTVKEAAATVNRAPTEAQKEAGNYAKGHTKVLGLDVSIENPKGATRSGIDKGGKPWSVKMPAHYGYVKRTMGVDGDHVDVYLGPKAEAADPGTVFVVNQRDATSRKFDEHKAMIGFGTKEAALDAYRAGFSDGKGQQRIQSVAKMTPDQFKDWVKGDIKGPATTPTYAKADALSSKAMEAKPPRRSLVEQENDEALGLYRALNPVARARERSTEDAKALDELNDMFGRYTATTDYDPNDGVVRVVNPRTGMAVEPVVSSTLGEMLRTTPLDTVGGVNDIISQFFGRRLREMVADVPAYVVSRQDMVALTQDYVERGLMETTPQAYYDPTTNVTVYDEAALTSEGALAHLLIHEGMHAAFHRTIENNPAAKRLIGRMMDHITEQTGKTADDLYGLTNEHEFISEAFSSAAFQDFLAGIPISKSLAQGVGRLSNLWEFFVAKVRAFLGMPKGSYTMLDGALRVGAALTQLRTTIATDSPSTPRAMAPLASQRILRAGLGSAEASRSVVGTTAKRAVMRVQTFQQLEQAWGHLFPKDGGGSYVTDVLRNIQRQGPFVQVNREKAAGFARRFLELQRSNPKLAQESAVLRNDITMANVNVLPGNPDKAAIMAANKHIFGDSDKSDISASWQAKAQFADLQRRFSALPEQVQEDIIEEAGFYREMQNRISKQLVENILDTFDVALKPGLRQDIATRTLAGTLTEDDAKLIGNTTIFNSLKNARELKAIKGMYFPLMRHGDYVVRTTDAVGDTMGGREVEPGVVEFRADKDADARAAAKRFTEKTGLVVTRVGKRYFDPKTGEQIKAVDADRSSHVAYRVSVQREGVHFFDSRTEAQKWVDQTRKDGTHAQVSDWMHRQDIESTGDLSGSQMASLVNAINQRDDIPEAQRKMMRTAIGQAAVRLMSGNRIQSKSLPRRRVQGASAEYGRNVIRYGEASANYLGKLHYMPAVRAAMSEMREASRNRYTKDAQDREHLFQEITRRVDSNTSGIKTPGKGVQTLMQVSMLSKLFSPAHSLINAMQPAMVTYPVMAGEHGPATTVLELSRAYRDIGAITVVGQGVANTARAARDITKVGIDPSDVMGSIRRKVASQADGKGINAMLDELTARGALDDGAGFEMASAIARGGGAVTTALGKMDRIFRQAPTAVEAINRGVTAVAAYRLAKRKGMSDAAATDYAYNMTVKTQGDYSPANAAPIFNHPVARPFLQFKKYGQMMTELYGGMVVRAFRNSSQGDRAVALKQLGNLVAVQVAMAGVLSIPGMELAKIGFVVAGALGMGGGWDDQERRIRRIADESLGKTWGELVTRGVISRAMGVDLSSRMSFADMWTFGEPRDTSKSETLGWLATQAIGAPGATALDIHQAILAIGEGDLMKAATTIGPAKVVTDAFKAVRGTSRGDISPVEAGLQVVGLRSGRMAERSETTAERIDTSRKAKAERNKMRTLYLDARTAGERAKAVARVREYNKTATGFNKLSIKSMDKMKERVRKERAL